MLNRNSLLAAFGAVVLGGLVTASAHAWTTSQMTTRLTFSGAVALPNVVLPAGTFLFERADPSASLDIVRVLSKDRLQVYFTGHTRHVERPVGMRRDRAVVFGEARRGDPLPIVAWYPVGSALGYQFIYEHR